MLDKYEKFFLGDNVDEPVAIEVAVTVKDIRDLGDFLANLGFDITYDGFEKGKILIDTISDMHADNGKTYSIITPALNPQDRIQFWSVLKAAIEEYVQIAIDRGDIIYNRGQRDKEPNMFYPHLLELKHLIVDSSNIGRDTDQGYEIEKILNELERSGEAQEFVPGSRWFDDEIKELFPDGYIYNGSTISDPYGVSTGYNTRFMRYGTKHPVYALNYTGVTRVKSINGYQNVAPRGRRSIGFVYQYQFRQDGQIFFDNSGIELEKNPEEYHRTINENDETVVTSFDNPCVGIYLMWGKIENPDKRFYIYRIDENDPRYQIIKNYYKPTNPNLHSCKRERFEAWNAEGENHTTYMPVRGGNLEQTKANVDAMIESERAKRQYEAERLKTLQTDINKISVQIQSVAVDLRVSAPTNKENILFVLENNDVIAKAEQKGKDILAILNEIKQQLDALRAEVENSEKLKAKYMSQIEQKEKNLKEKIDECNKGLQNLSHYKETNNFTIKLLIKQYGSTSALVDTDSFKKMPLEIRKEILNLFLEKAQFFISDKDMQIIAGRLIRLYALAPEQDKIEIFDLLYKIREKVPNDFRKVIKKNIDKFTDNKEDLEVLTELFSRDGWFIKHTERAKDMAKKIALRTATIRLQQQLANQNSAAVIEHDPRDM